MEPEPSTSAVAGALQLDATAFVNDLVNSVHHHSADAFDQLDEVIVLDLQLTPQQHAAAIQGVQALFLQLEAELQEQLAKFEQHAVEGCLHVPAGLLAQPASAAQAAAEEQVDEAEEAAGQAEYQRLRGELEATRQAAHQRQRQIRQLEGLLEWSKAQAGQLGEVVSQMAGKENALAEDAQALARVAMDTERLVANAAALQQRQQQQHRTGGRSNGGGNLDAERDILRRQPEIVGKPPDALQRIQQRLAG